jgi:biotin transport system permease protein
MLGLYIPRDSPIHCLPAGLKVAALIVAGIGILAVGDPVPLAGLLAGVGALLAVARLPAGAVVAHLRPVLLLALFFFAVHVLLGDVRTGVIIVLRFVILIALAALVTLTTRVSDMVDALERGLRPLRIVGINPDKTSLMISLAIRFVPVLMEQVRSIQEAQRARGLERSVIGVAVPLIVKTLRMANSLTEAIEARGYDPDGTDHPGQDHPGHR